VGLLSSKSSSSTSNYSDEKNYNTLDNRVIDADTANVGGNVSINAGAGVSGVTVTTTDFGAIDTAGDIAEQSFSFSGSTVTSALDSVNKTVSGALSSVSSSASQAISAAKDATQGEGAKTIQIAIAGAAIVAAVFIFRAKK